MAGCLWREGVKEVREFVVDLFISLDGFASGANEPPFFGYFGEQLGAWIGQELDQPQFLIMGRVTYEALAEFAPKAQDPISLKMTELPKLVFSSQLQEPLVWRNTQLLRVPAAPEIRALKAQEGARLRSIGSIRLVQSLIEAGLVDRLRLMIFPLVLGNGGREPIFSRLARTPLQLLRSQCLDSRILLLEYAPPKQESA
ncbi:MAG TPA: dihydrofolate reductase family protein [Terracidiphilus sp.]|nr:dihydrofolate reductase family protein [Terracidiphilus sp.]